MGVKLAASKIDETRVKRLPLERRSLGVPSLLNGLHLFFLLSSWKSHLLSSLLLHDLSDCSLSLLIEVL